MSDANAVYNYERIIARELAKIEKDPFNAELLLKYYRARVAEGLSLARNLKCLTTMRLISRSLGKRFEEATKDDIIDLVGRIENRNVSAWTKRDYKAILKRFYKWFRDTEERYPPEVSWIKVCRNIPNNLQKKDLLTVEEIEKIADQTTNVRDKAFIWVFFESMRRFGEIATMSIRNVEFDDLGARLTVDGKMGRANGRIITATSLLASWLNIHPLKKDPNAPLWVTLNRKGEYKQMTYSAIRSMLKDCAKRAGINKRVWLYLIRHSRITPASKVLSYSLLCSTAGWKQGSKMPSVYIHLGADDIDEAQCILNGLAKTQVKEEALKPATCCKCGTKNIPSSKFCGKCGFPLNSDAAIEMDETRTKLDKLLDKLTEDPQKLNKLLALIDQ